MAKPPRTPRKRKKDFSAKLWVSLRRTNRLPSRPNHRTTGDPNPTSGRRGRARSSGDGTAATSAAPFQEVPLMPRRSSSIAFLLLLVSLHALTATGFSAQVPPNADQVQISPPPFRSIEPPAPDATAASLENRGDGLRVQKLYLDAIDFYRAALAKKPNSAALYNKIGIAELLMQRWSDSRKSFERAIKSDREDADAYNNLGVIF